MYISTRLLAKIKTFTQLHSQNYKSHKNTQNNIKKRPKFHQFTIKIQTLHQIKHTHKSRTQNSR